VRVNKLTILDLLINNYLQMEMKNEKNNQSNEPI
jgi:hypothetical protein